jgi:type II secretory ATPase GspE/PulE/Tfp pilus assembly ATPase PilB-like protein
MDNEDASILTQAARRNGMRTLREDGWLKVKNGVTTAAEVTRVTQEF